MKLNTEIKTSKDLSVFNNIDQLYEQEPKLNTKNEHVCPVCGKTYKRESGIKKHMSKKDCFSYLALLKDTMLELSCYQLYKLLMVEVEPNKRITVSLFRKSNYYKNIARFMIFCKLHEIKNINSYILYINHQGADHPQTILKQGIKEATLHDYRLYQQLNAAKEIDSVEFMDRYKKDLLTDHKFLVRSLEKSHIGLIYLAFEQQEFDFDERVDSLPLDYKNRVLDLADKVLSELEQLS